MPSPKCELIGKPVRCVDPDFEGQCGIFIGYFTDEPKHPSRNTQTAKPNVYLPHPYNVMLYASHTRVAVTDIEPLNKQG